MSPETIGALLFGGVIVYALLMGGTAYVVLLAASVADRPDDTEQIEEVTA